MAGEEPSPQPRKGLSNRSIAQDSSAWELFGSTRIPVQNYTRVARDKDGTAVEAAMEDVKEAKIIVHVGVDWRRIVPFRLLCSWIHHGPSLPRMPHTCRRPAEPVLLWTVRSVMRWQRLRTQPPPGQEHNRAARPVRAVGDLWFECLSNLPNGIAPLPPPPGPIIYSLQLASMP